ncbi:MAG: FkbM family methyltransferase [Thalassobaculaceae bacterium]
MSTFGSDDVFLDIGANIGRYSVLATVAAGTKTIAVEPFSVNVDALERNIALNGLQDDVTAIRAAIHDVTGDGLLQFSERVAGAADQRFRAGPDTDDPAGAEPLAGYRLDDLVDGGRIAFPTHIKIDVDGGEHRLIDGMAETLRDERLRSIRLEIQLDETGNPAALERIRQAGFDCAIDDDRKNFLCRR